MRIIHLAVLLPVVIATPARAQGRQDVPIEHPQTLAGGRLPVVRVTINGHAALFLLDTGANATVLGARFAATLGLASHTGPAPGQDSAGDTVPTRAVGALDLQLGPVRRHVARIEAVPLGPLGALGIDGVLSPQTLADRACVKVDFARDLLTMIAPDDGGCAFPGEPVALNPKGLPVASLVGADGQSVRFLLDSGASRTSVPATFAAPLAGGTEAHAGIGGAIQHAALTGPVTLRIGGQEIAMPSAAVASPARGPVLGFDVLRSATILFRPQGDGVIALAK